MSYRVRLTLAVAIAVAVAVAATSGITYVLVRNELRGSGWPPVGDRRHAQLTPTPIRVNER